MESKKSKPRRKPSSKTKKTSISKVKLPQNSQGIYSSRTVSDNGTVNLEIDWEKLREHIRSI